MSVSAFERSQILEAWKKRPINQRTEKDVVLFYPSVAEHLAGAPTSDPYQFLRTILKNYITE